MSSVNDEQTKEHFAKKVKYIRFKKILLEIFSRLPEMCSAIFIRASTPRWVIFGLEAFSKWI